MAKHQRSGSGLVYSSDGGEMCPACEKPVDQCSCPSDQQAKVVGDGIVRVGRETKGRKGAGVTVITGIGGSVNELTALCTRLKKRCGSGGTLKDGVIEIQGDHRDMIVLELTKEGRRVKRVGG